MMKFRKNKSEAKEKLEFRVSNFEFPREARRGFTLTEMFFVMMIIAILTAIGSRTYFDERDRFIYNDALNKTLGIIKTARNMATTATPIAQAGVYEVPVNGYGVYINLDPASNEAHFTLFASFGDDDSNPSTYNERYDKQSLTPPDTRLDYIVEEFTLSHLVDFQYFLFDDGNGAGLVEKWDKTNPLNQFPTEKEAVIIFRPPLADTYLGDNSGNDLEEIGMRFYNHKAPSSSPKKCQYIYINRVKTFPTIEYTDCT